MKTARHTDAEIAEYLRTRGVTYTPKAINTRWRRLRAKLAARRDEELDAGVVGWTEAHDTLLLAAVTTAAATVQRLHAAAEAQRWPLVAAELQRQDTSATYSQRSCRARFEALQAGTAALNDPVEMERAREEYERGKEAERVRIERSRVRARETSRVKARVGAARRREEARRRVQLGRLDGRLRVDGELLLGGECTPPPPPPPPLPPFLLLEHPPVKPADHVPQPAHSTSDAGSTPRPNTASNTTSNSIGPLSYAAELALRATAATNDIRLPDGVDLLPPEELSRDELRAELKARGCKQPQIKAGLLAAVRAVRGETGMYGDDGGRDGNGNGLVQGSSQPPDPRMLSDLASKRGVEKKRGKLSAVAMLRAREKARKEVEESGGAGGEKKKGRGRGRGRRKMRQFKSADRVPTESPEPETEMQLESEGSGPESEDGEEGDDDDDDGDGDSDEDEVSKDAEDDEESGELED